MKVGIVGSSGYGGKTLLHILQNHPDAQVKMAVTSDEKLQGKEVVDAAQPFTLEESYHPGFSYDIQYSAFDPVSLSALDVVFLAVPHGMAKGIAKKLYTKVIDLSSDHRLSHTYGIPERDKNWNVKYDTIIANPGCYATAALLSGVPLFSYFDDHDVWFEEYHISGISGFSGLGRNCETSAKTGSMFMYAHNYHNHIPEIHMMLDDEITMSAHIVPFFAGLTTTSWIKTDVDADSVKKHFVSYFEGSLVKMVELPKLDDVVGTPHCEIGIYRKDDYLVIVASLDNLWKGQASQAVENMNLVFGLDHKVGL